MIANRQDAWTPDDDLLLAEVTLRYIREGGTQLQAFEEVAEKLGRTSAACGFRWNSTVRKNYESAITLAKGQRQKNKRKRNDNKRVEKIESTLTRVEKNTENQEIIDIEKMIQFLQNYKQKIFDLETKTQDLTSELQKKEQEIEELRKENQRISQEQSTTKSVNDDYLALVKIMERARKLAMLETEEKPVFKMDANGNLDRVNK